MSEIDRRIQWNYIFITICSGYCLIFAFWEYVQILNVFTRKLSIDLFSKLKLIWNISDNVNLETTREAFFINAKIIISYIECHAQRSYYVLLTVLVPILVCISQITNTILLMPLKCKFPIFWSHTVEFYINVIFSLIFLGNYL